MGIAIPKQSGTAETSIGGAICPRLVPLGVFISPMFHVTVSMPLIPFVPFRRLCHLPDYNQIQKLDEDQ